MAKQKFWSLLICSLLLCAAATAADFDPNGQLTFTLGGEVSILNPILSTDTSSSSVEGPIFNGLTKINEKLEIIPNLAKSWKVSSDGKTWTFNLRDDVLWHDGKPFTAHDVKFTFDTILNPKVNSVRRSSYIIDGKPIGFGVKNKYTIQAILPKPFAPFLSRIGIGILPKHLLAGKDINTAEFNRKPIGTGPFKFAEWKKGHYARLIRNDKYFGTKPLLKEIIYKVIPNENASLIALEAGEVDEAGIPFKDYSRMKSTKGLNVYEYDGLIYTYLGFNIKHPIFKNRNVRRALAYATNKKQLVGLVLRGHGTPAYAPEAPISWAYSEDVQKFPYNPTLAKAMLKKAGYEKGFEFTVLLNQGNKNREKAAIILQQQYKKVGVKMNIRVMEWSAMLKIVNAPKGPKDFDAVLMGWSLGLDPDQFSIWHSTQYPRGFNFIGYHNKEVDRLSEKGRVTMDRKTRKLVYAKLNRIISEDQPYIFLWYPKVISGVRDRVGGLSKPGPGGLFLNIEKVYIRKK